MADQDHAIFREHAIEKYRQRQDQHTILHLAYPPVMLFLWPLLLLIFATILFICSIQVPIDVTETAMIVENGGQLHQTKPQIVVLLLFSQEPQSVVHPGQLVRFCLEKPDQCINASVETGVTPLMSPQAIRDQYQLPPSLALTVTGPSKVVIASLESSSLGSMYLGSQGHVTIQTGSQSVLSLLSDFNRLATIEKG